MDLGIGNTVFYTRSNGLRHPATVVAMGWTLPIGILLGWADSGESVMQDGVHLFCHPQFRFFTSLPSISTAQCTVKFFL